MNNTVISILIVIGLFGVIAIMAFLDEGPPKLDFQEIVTESVNGEASEEGTSTESSVEIGVEENGSITEEVVSGDTSDSSLLEDEDIVSEEVVSENETATVEEVAVGSGSSNSAEIEEADVSVAEESETGETEEVEVVEEEALEEEQESELVVEDSVESVTPPSDFVLHLLFDEKTEVRAEDATGHSNYGTLVNTDPLISWIDGQIDGGLFLDGLNDYVGISHSETLNIGAQTQSYTIGFWFRSTDEPGNEVQVIGKGGRSGPSPFSIRLNKDGEPSIRVSDGIEATTLKLSNSVANGSWKHLTAIRDGNTKRLRMYIDGIEYGGLVYDTSTKSLQNTAPVLINRFESGQNEYRYHNFSLDDLRIYNRALTLEEIRGIVNEGRI